MNFYKPIYGEGWGGITRLILPLLLAAGLSACSFTEGSAWSQIKAWWANQTQQEEPAVEEPAPEPEKDKDREGRVGA